MSKPPKGMSLEDYRARHREYQRTYVALKRLDPAYRAKRGDDQQRRYLAHPEKKRAAQARYVATFTPAEWKERRKIARQRQAAKRPSPPPHPLGLHAAALWRLEIWATAAKAVPRTLPTHIWEDAVSELVLAVLERQVAPKDMRKSAARFVTAAWGPRFTSLDAIIPGTDRLTLMDKLSNETEHF